jgi:hypothetical protein
MSHDKLNHYYKLLASYQDDEEEQKPRSLGDCITDDGEIDIENTRDDIPFTFLLTLGI